MTNQIREMLSCDSHDKSTFHLQRPLVMVLEAILLLTCVVCKLSNMHCVHGHTENIITTIKRAHRKFYVCSFDSCNNIFSVTMNTVHVRKLTD